jgi:gamma-glutamyltranspeptidase/glutathione hydrolase
MSHGSAVGAVLCGFFAAGGAYAGVLWGPVSILVGGVGVGVRAFDGRLVQPGEGAKRPRGFVEGEAIPTAARVPATSAVAACLVAFTYAGGSRLASIIKPGATRARQSGAEARAEFLMQVRSAGAGALSEPRFVREVVKAAGPVQGGLIGPRDFDAARLTLDEPAALHEEGGRKVWTTPWAREPAAVGAELGHGHAIVAIDVRGVAAAVCYRRVNEGFSVPALDLELPTLASPVQRGVPRTSPGTRLSAPSPIAITSGAASALEVVAYPSASSIDDTTGLCLRLSRDGGTREVAAWGQ